MAQPVPAKPGDKVYLKGREGAFRIVDKDDYQFTVEPADGQAADFRFVPKSDVRGEPWPDIVEQTPFTERAEAAPPAPAPGSPPPAERSVPDVYPSSKPTPTIPPPPPPQTQTTTGKDEG